MSSSDSDSTQASSDAQQRTTRTSNRREPDHDEPSSDDSSGDESENSHSGEEQSNFLDLEAEESDEDSHGSGDNSDHEFSHIGGMNALPYREELYSFPQFTRLPIELRHRIWDFVDPDLRVPHRVFKFRLPLLTTPRLRESELLGRQTAPARAVLSTHQESRDYALRFYPDTIVFESGNASVRCRKETDVIAITADWELLLTTFVDAAWQPLQHTLSQVKHMALEVDLLALDTDIPQNFINRKILGLGSSMVPSLDAFYFIYDDGFFRPQDIKWCVTDVAHSFQLQTEEQEEGLGEDVDVLLCWPDLTKKDQLDCARRYVDQTDEGENGDDDTDDRREDGWDRVVIIHNDKVAAYPMVQFAFDRGLCRYDLIRSVNSQPGGWEKNWDPKNDGRWVHWEYSDEGSEIDEYESEGIDDRPIEDSDGDSDEDSEMVYHGGYSDGEGPDNLSGPVSYMSAESSPAQSTTREALATANFSDPEFSESSDQNSDDGTGDDERPTRLGKQRGRGGVAADTDEDSSDEDEINAPKESRQPKRAVVMDSDDDNETSDEEPAPPKRRKRAVVSDSDDEISDLEKPQPSRRCKRTATSDSDDSDEGSDIQQSQPSRRRKREVLSESDGNDESAKTEEPRPLKRQKRVVVSDSDSDDEGTIEKRGLPSKQRKRVAVPESDEDSVDSDEDSATEAGSSDDASGSDEDSSGEEAERPKKKPSLAERLNLFRSQVPAAPSPGAGSDADSDMAQLRNGDYDEPDAHSDDAVDADDMDEVSANEAWDEPEGDSEGEPAW